MSEKIEEFVKKSDIRIRFTSDGYVALYDILQIMGITTNEKKRVAKYKTAIRKHCIQLLSPTQKWNPESESIVDIKSAKETPCADLPHTIKFMGYFLKKVADEVDVRKVIERFQLPESILTLPTDIQPHTEKEILGKLVQALPWPCITQFAIGSHRIDLYIPKYKIAVECDEFDHVQYNTLDEEARQLFISKQLTCNWVRFDPYNENFCIFNVIRRILKVAFV